MYYNTKPIHCERVDACRIKVEIAEHYAERFLAIFNNVRECPELLAVHNYLDTNYVTVYAKVEYVEAVREWLGCMGEIVSVRTNILAYVPVDADYDYDAQYEAIVVGDVF